LSFRCSVVNPLYNLMGFVKVIKNKAYYKRFQVKYRRRREGKTDYQARRQLICQDKNKYNSPKYRLVVRLTNRDIICQIVVSKINGDYVLTAAYSHELQRFGLTVGLTNYAAAYCTGLLIGRRHLTKLGLSTRYVGKENVDGSDFNVEALPDGPRPFLAILDIGLYRTTTGARIFAAMKGAVDAGMNVPHSDKRFFGFNGETKKFDPKALRKIIFGGHVSDYMKKLADDNPTKYQRQFSRYIKAGLTPDKIEGVYKKVHADIRKDPAAKAKDKKPAPEKQKRWGKKKLTPAERDNRVKQRIEAHQKSLAAAEKAAENAE